MAKSKLSNIEARHDAYHKQARKQGFASRAVFKLKEIDDKLKLFQPGQRVLDLGCAPGSWLQYAANKVGPKGQLVGIDRFEIKPSGPNWRTIVGDLYETSQQELLGDLEGFDIVLSDMAPDTTGIRHVDQTRSEDLFELALNIALDTLSPGGHFVAKIFQGPEFHRLLTRCRNEFDKAKAIKPKGSRKESIEQYICGISKKAVSDND